MMIKFYDQSTARSLTVCLPLVWVSGREHVPNSEGFSEGKLLVHGSNTAEMKVTGNK